MRTFTGIGVVLLLEAVLVAGAVAWRRRRQAASSGSTSDKHHLTAILEVEDNDALLATGTRRLPLRIIKELRADRVLGLADVQVVQHIQPTGAGLPERSQVGRSYQSLNQAVARTDALRLTWMSLRLELPGSRNAAWADRAAGPIEARGGGSAGATKTLDKAVRSATSKLTAAGFSTTRLGEDDLKHSFATSYGVLANTDIEAGTGGVLVGLDPAHLPVVLGLFGRRPLTMAFVGGLAMAQLLALRAAAVGARIIVETGRPEEWDSLTLHSGLDKDRLAVQPVGRVAGHPGWVRPAPTAPVFVVRDSGARPPYAALPQGPWTTVLTLLPYLDPRTAGQLAQADLVGLQRMPTDEIAVARIGLRLTDKDAEALPDLPDSMTLWRAKGGNSRYCETTATAWETGIVGDLAR